MFKLSSVLHIVLISCASERDHLLIVAMKISMQRSSKVELPVLDVCAQILPHSPFGVFHDTLKVSDLRMQLSSLQILYAIQT